MRKTTGCLLGLGFVWMAQAAYAQKLFFPKSNWADSAVLARAIPALAREVIEKYKEGDESDYNNNLFRLQIVGGSFDEALTTLNKFDEIYAKKINNMAMSAAIGFQYRMYGKIMLENPGKAVISSAVFEKVFTPAYNSLNEASQNIVSLYYNRDLADLKSGLETKINAVKETDSLTISEALDICKAYCGYLVYAATLAPGKMECARIERERYIMDDSVLVKMPDGGLISLAITRVRKVTAPQPVVMLYNIYAGGDLESSEFISQKGYVGIVANTRGKRLSPGVVEPMEHDAEDAYYIIDWISKQPWCNGKIGMYGGSYLGFAQWSAMKNPHPALKTIVPQVAVGAGIDYPMQNGVFMSYMLQWIHYVSDIKLTDEAGFDVKKWEKVFGDWYKKGGSFRSMDTLEGRPNAIFHRWLDHPSYDSYWQHMTPQKDEFGKINIPILTITGYWDDDQLGALYYYRQYHLWNRHPDHYLIIGPFDHGGSQFMPKAKMGGYEIDSVARIPINDIVFQWFDHVLKDSALPAILQDRVNFEVMGADKWVHVALLDNMHNDSVSLFLGNIPHDGRYPLLAVKPPSPAFIEQQIDFSERGEVKFKNGDIDAFDSLLSGSLDTEKTKMIFVSDPITNPYALSGSFKASIDISINKKDVDLVLDLYEQTPEGKYLALNENLQRASYAKDKSKRQLLEPGKMQRIQIVNTFITSRRLEKGSRIIVMIGVNKNPSWEINYGTGKDVSVETIKDAGEPLKIKWFNSSFVQFPILR